MGDPIANGGGLIFPGEGGRGLSHEALSLRGAQPLLLVVVELDGSLTFLAPDTMSDSHLETLTQKFFAWKAEYKARRRETRGRTTL